MSSNQNSESLSSWYLVRSKPHQEQVAEWNLQRLGVDTFYPRLKHMKIVRKKKHMVVDALFPGYLFAKFTLSEEYRKVAYAHGVLDVVKFGTAPAVVDEVTIASIQARLHDGCVQVSPSSFQVGQTVQINGGLFKGLEAVFEQEMSGIQRVALLLKSVSFNPRIIIDRELVTNG